MRKCAAIVLALSLSAISSTERSSAATIGTQLVTGGLSNPIDVMQAPGDNRYLYIVERGVTAGNGNGTADIRIFDTQTNAILPTPFATFSNVNNSGEEGLLGLAFDPGFATNHKFYVNLSTGPGTTTATWQNVLSLTASSYTSGGAGVTANASNTLMSWSNPYSNIHKAGWIGFSPPDPNNPGSTLRTNDDHDLYIATGDGSTYPKLNDPNNAANDSTGPLGKILRIHVDPNSSTTYTIPPTNMYAGVSGKQQEIFAYGLRNPFRASFDTKTGDLYLGDVGQDAREEIDVQKSSQPNGGNNYGWRYREGSIATPKPTSSESAAGATPIGGPLQGGETGPILEYQHPGITVANSASPTGGTIMSLANSTANTPANPSLPSLIGNCVIGGVAYEGSALTSVIPKGAYFFGDLYGDTWAADNVDNQKAQINSMVYDDATDTVSGLTDWTNLLNPGSGTSTERFKGLVGFGTDNAGEIYVIDIGSNSNSVAAGDGAGSVWKIVPVPEPASYLLLMVASVFLLWRKKASAIVGMTRV